MVYILCKCFIDLQLVNRYRSECFNVQSGLLYMIPIPAKYDMNIWVEMSVTRFNDYAFSM